MGQQEIFDFLKKHKGRWFTYKDISEEIDIQRNTVSQNIIGLKKRGDIVRRYVREFREGHLVTYFEVMFAEEKNRHLDGTEETRRT